MFVKFKPCKAMYAYYSYLINEKGEILKKINGQNADIILSEDSEFVNVEKIMEFVNSQTVCASTKVFQATAGNHAGMIGAVLLGNELI